MPRLPLFDDQLERIALERGGRGKRGENETPTRDEILNKKNNWLLLLLLLLTTTLFLLFRVVSYAVPPQEILSKDSVTVSVDAVVYFRTSDPVASVNNGHFSHFFHPLCLIHIYLYLVDDAIYSTKLLAQTTLRNALGMKTLTEMLTEREAIAQLCETVRSNYRK